MTCFILICGLSVLQDQESVQETLEKRFEAVNQYGLFPVLRKGDRIGCGNDIDIDLSNGAVQIIWYSKDGRRSPKPSGLAALSVDPPRFRIPDEAGVWFVHADRITQDAVDGAKECKVVIVRAKDGAVRIVLMKDGHTFWRPGTKTG